jgi:hypothetical protein
VGASLVAPLVIVPLAVLTAFFFVRNGDLATGTSRQALQFTNLETGMDMHAPHVAADTQTTGNPVREEGL